jgi:hypothetical protein
LLQFSSEPDNLALYDIKDIRTRERNVFLGGRIEGAVDAVHMQAASLGVEPPEQSFPLPANSIEA